jgi:threonine dehydratase
VTASAGNHAQGVALAATRVGLDATIVMPTNAPQAKINATRSYGGDVALEGNDFQEALAHAETLTDDARPFVHAYDDPDIVAGQGTLGLEIAEDVPQVDTVVVPIGGGGLIGGVSAALSGLDRDVRIVGVQAEAAATVPQSLQKGGPETLESVDTIADGIATGGISELTYELIASHVDEVVTVSDQQIAGAILVLLERAKQLVEGAGAVPVAAIRSAGLDVSGETVVPVLSGGNLDPSMLQTVLTHALTDRGQILHLRVKITDRPGQMARLSGLIGDYGANIRTVRHDRAVEDLEVGEAYLDFEIETGGQEHAEGIIDSIEELGYSVTRMN